MRWKTSQLSGWGRNRLSESRVARPERFSDFIRSIESIEDGGVIAHGSGRSYGDTALNENGQVVLTTRLNRFIGFDADTDELIVEPGVTFSDLLNVFLPKGYMAPASPGTASVTIGGAVANDIHGKNHDVVGSFGHHVRWLDLLLPSGEVVRVSSLRRTRGF